MSWGHAVSRDLLRWDHLPIALREQDGIMIFSGSAVFDAKNSSGLGRPDAPPMVAVYTGDGHKKQTQNLASSLDKGRTWTKFAGNPVLDLNSNSFRDPKVFWHKPTGRWIMATVLADDRKVRLWGSTDLKAWEKLSDFGPAGSVKGVWECPELFEVPVEGGENGESRWILKVDVNDGAPFGGSGGQYFVGRFDGREFRAEGKTSDPLWIDFGKDFYASQTWNDAPGGRPVWIAWMNNWQYANEIPTSPWRGAMTLPRTVALRKTDDGLRIVQAPVETLKAIRRRAPQGRGPADPGRGDEARRPGHRGPFAGDHRRVRSRRRRRVRPEGAMRRGRRDRDRRRSSRGDGVRGPDPLRCRRSSARTSPAATPRTSRGTTPINPSGST